LLVSSGSIIIGLGAALLIESHDSWRGFYRTAFFMPVASTLIAMAVVWQFLMHPTVGFLNHMLSWFGIAPRNWLLDYSLALPSLAAIGIWQMSGLAMVMFLAGLKNIPTEMRHASLLDGMSHPVDRFFRLTLPMLGPTLLFVVTICGIRSLQVFDTVHALTQGGPNKATEVLLHTIYAEGFGFFRMGYASAMVVIFVACVVVLTLVQQAGMEKGRTTDENPMQASLPWRALRHGILLAGAAIYLLPFMWMLSTSLKPAEEIFRDGFHLLPQQWAAVENYSRALTQVPLLRYLLNGVIVCGAILLLQIIVSLPAAYCFAKLQFRGKRLAWGLVLLSLMIPFQATSIPLYIMLYHAGLLDTTAALVIPFIASAFGIFLMRQFFMGVPDDLINAARLDGMGEFELVWRILMPAAMPALTAFAIFSVVWHWNDYFWPLLVINTQDLATPPLGTMFFANEESGNDYGPLMAGTVLITIPLVVFFLFAQKRFIEGVTFSGVKA